MLYEQFKGRPDLTGIQERLILLVHMRKKQIRLKEMELHVLANMTGDNAKQLNSMLDTYRKMLFPGAEEDSAQEEEMAKAKAALAKAAKTVLVVRKLKDGERPAGKMHPELARLGAHHAANLEREKMKQSRMLRNKQRRKKR